MSTGHGTDAAPQRDLRAIARRALAEGDHALGPGQGRDRRRLRPRDPLGLLQHQAAVGDPAAAPDSHPQDGRVRAVLAREHLRARQPRVPVLRRRVRDQSSSPSITSARSRRAAARTGRTSSPAASRCNRRKGGRTPEQAGMHLIRHPRRPDKAPAIRITFGLRNAPRELARLRVLERRARRRRPSWKAAVPDVRDRSRPSTLGRSGRTGRRLGHRPAHCARRPAARARGQCRGACRGVLHAPAPRRRARHRRRDDSH